MDAQAQPTFLEIATHTGGKCQELNVNNADGQKKLLDLFLEKILEKLGDLNGGIGQQLVESYKRKFAA